MTPKTHKNNVSEGLNLDGESGYVFGETQLLAWFCHVCKVEGSQCSAESMMTIQQLAKHGEKAHGIGENQQYQFGTWLICQESPERDEEVPLASEKEKKR